MKKKPLLYIIAFALLITILIFFGKAYKDITVYSELSNRHSAAHSKFQTLYQQLNTVGILNPHLFRSEDPTKGDELFVTDSTEILHELDLLNAAVIDSINIQIAGKLTPLIKTELPWLFDKSTSDPIRYGNPSFHIAAFKTIDSLLTKGIQRSVFMIEYRRGQFTREIDRIKTLIIIFAILSFLLLGYTAINYFKQLSKAERKEKELEIVLNRISDGVVSVDTNWRYTFLNDAALATHPLGKKETIGKIIWDIHPEMIGTIFWDKYHEAMLTKKVVEVESHYPPMDIWFSVKVYPSDNGVTIFYRDVTETKKLEDKQALFVSIVNSSEDGIFSQDLNSVVTSWNKGAEKIFGYTAEEIIGKNIFVLIPTHRRPEEKEAMQELSGGQLVEHYETERIRKDGSLIQVSLTISPLRDSSGNVIGASKIVHDITKRKEVENKLKNAQLNITELNHDLEEKIKIRTEQLNKSNEDLEAFSYSVSHDLRAPLRGIIGFAAILEEDHGKKLDAEANRIIAVIKNNTIRMGQLIDDLLAFSRIGKQEIQKNLIDTKMVVEQIVTELSEQNGSGTTIKWEINKLLPANADKNTIRQVWVNLLSNAVKYSSKEDRPCITIDSYIKDGDMVFSIKDNGVGFDEQYSNKLFKVFQRLHDSHEFEGTGIGLALVEKVVSKHGGKVWAEGKPDQGACFYFSLPL